MTKALLKEFNQGWKQQNGVRLVARDGMRLLIRGRHVLTKRAGQNQVRIGCTSCAVTHRSSKGYDCEPGPFPALSERERRCTARGMIYAFDPVTRAPAGIVRLQRAVGTAQVQENQADTFYSLAGGITTRKRIVSPARVPGRQYRKS